ncbi:MAG: hypothetical protein M3N37_02975, partial [Actinomycetota bacterium]|nr:hypothetical protein [Actinomycetota bacterium]
MWLLVAIVTSVVLGPRVFTGAPADVPEELLVATGVPGSSVLPFEATPARSGPSPTVVLTASVEIPDEPPTPEPPAPATSEVTSDTEAPASTTTTAKPVASTTTTTAPAPTTTTAAPPPPPPPAPEPDPAALSATHADGVHEGMVSWYDLPGA